MPLAATSGSAPGENLLALLFGTGRPFDAATLARLYPGGGAEYLRRFTTALDRAIAAGHLCAADRDEILLLAGAAYPA